MGLCTQCRKEQNKGDVLTRDIVPGICIEVAEVFLQKGGITMVEITKETTQKDTKFIGEVSDPFCSPKITQGLVEFKVRYVQGNLLLYKTAQLISESGEVYPVIVRAIGLVHPDLAANPSWDPRDLHVRVGGISLEKAKEMCKLVQEHVPDR